MEGKCESCKHFIPRVTVIEGSLEIWGYGCSLGGSELNKETFFNGCNEYKGKHHVKEE